MAELSFYCCKTGRSLLISGHSCSCSSSRVFREQRLYWDLDFISRLMRRTRRDQRKRSQIWSSIPHGELCLYFTKLLRQSTCFKQSCSGSSGERISLTTISWKSRLQRRMFLWDNSTAIFPTLCLLSSCWLISYFLKLYSCTDICPSIYLSL